MRCVTYPALSLDVERAPDLAILFIRYEMGMGNGEWGNVKVGEIPRGIKPSRHSKINTTKALFTGLFQAEVNI